MRFQSVRRPPRMETHALSIMRSPRPRRILCRRIGGGTRPSCPGHDRACIPKNADAIPLQHGSPLWKRAATPDLRDLDAIAPKISNTSPSPRYLGHIEIGTEGGDRDGKALEPVRGASAPRRIHPL